MKPFHDSTFHAGNSILWVSSVSRDTCVTFIFNGCLVFHCPGASSLAWPAPFSQTSIVSKFCYFAYSSEWTGAVERELIPCPLFCSFLKEISRLDSKLSNDTKNPLGIMEVRAPDPFRTILGLVMNENKEAGSFPTVWKGSFSLLVMVPKYNTAPWSLHCNQLVHN